jgi:hypothetical protein
MTSRARVAMTISGDKAQHPERYCPARRCLWKTAEIGPDGEYILNADSCRKHPELNTAPSRKADRAATYCPNCGAEITETDVEAGYCTQCKAIIGIELLPLSHQLLLSLSELQSQRDEEVA